MAALAELLGVSITYFFDSATEERINADLEALAAIKDRRARNLMVLAQGVSPESMELVEAMLERIRQLERLERADMNPHQE